MDKNKQYNTQAGNFGITGFDEIGYSTLNYDRQNFSLYKAMKFLFFMVLLGIGICCLLLAYYAIG